MKDLAEQEASRLISEVKQRAERSAELKIAQAEDEGRRIIEEAVKTAEMEAQHIKGEAGQTLQVSKKLDTDRIQERFDKCFDEFPSGAADTGRSREIPADRTQVENKEELALYGGTVELAIRPPITLDRIVKLHRHLRGSPQVQVLNVERSADKGLKMRLLLRDRTPLLDVLKTLPEVKKVSTLQPADSNKAYAQGTGTKDNVQRIVVTTRE
jgi:vacuolar-type H+-ATPase subunit H